MTMPRVGLTTTPERVARLADLIERRGLLPVAMSTIAIANADPEILEKARSMATTADWIVVTSSRAVEAVWPDGGMPAVHVAAVGPATAEAVADAGGRVSVVGEHGSAELLADLTGSLGGRRVFFPHAADANPATERLLVEAEAEVDAIPVYETLPVPPPAGPVDAVVFGSPSAIEGWCLGRDLTGVVIGAIGETTRAALVERGYEADVMPPNPDYDLLIEMLADHLTERSPS